MRVGSSGEGWHKVRLSGALRVLSGAQKSKRMLWRLPVLHPELGAHQCMNCPFAGWESVRHSSQWGQEPASIRDPETTRLGQER